MSGAVRRSLLRARARAPDQHHRVTYIELFFDLVFVFAVTQVSQTLRKDLTSTGLLQVTLLFLAVWWVWIYTSWVTNWLDPEKTPVRVLLFMMMLGGLVLSTSLPEAFGAHGAAFGIAFAAMQVGRSACTLAMIPAAEPRLRMNFVRILAWLAVSGALWTAGGLAPAQLRLPIWSIAVAIEYLGPVARFWLPGIGASAIEDWNVEGGHMAERCALFIIIALGESVLVTGATFSDLAWAGDTISAVLVSLGGSIAMWWIYFHKGAEAGAETISHADAPGRLARLAYTYFHMPIVAGIILAAVADELVLAQPAGTTGSAVALSATGGPLLFLTGTLLFKWAVRSLLQLSHLVGIAALLALAALASFASPLQVSAAATLILIVVASWEALSLRGASPIPEEIETGP